MVGLSNSTLSIYRECRRCFWLHMNQNVKRPRGIFPSLPSGMDLILKDYFNKYRVKGEIPPLISGRVKGRLADISLNLNFLDRDNDLKITGRLDDCLVMDSNIYIPLDHKTRGRLPGDPNYSYKYYKRQMDTYALLLKNNGYKTAGFAYIVYYSPAQGELHNGFPFKTEVHELKTEPGSVHGLYVEARQSLLKPIPASGSGCEYCQWLDQASKF